MKIKTQDLTGAALDWAVAKALNLDYYQPDYGPSEPEFSTDWAQGGPIIDRTGILFRGEAGDYTAWIVEPYAKVAGPTHLIAAMRCFVASELGDEVEIPEELA